MNAEVGTSDLNINETASYIHSLLFLYFRIYIIYVIWVFRNYLFLQYT